MTPVVTKWLNALINVFLWGWSHLHSTTITIAIAFSAFAMVEYRSMSTNEFLRNTFKIPKVYKTLWNNHKLKSDI